MGNIHFTEIADFFLGWFGFDISKDDWATRIADEERALNDLDNGKPKEPAKEATKEPPEASPPKPAPAENPPPKKPKKNPPPRSQDYDLRDIIP